MDELNTVLWLEWPMDHPQKILQVGTGMMDQGKKQEKGKV